MDEWTGKQMEGHVHEMRGRQGRINGGLMDKLENGRHTVKKERINLKKTERWVKLTLK